MNGSNHHHHYHCKHYQKKFVLGNTQTFTTNTNYNFYDVSDIEGIEKPLSFLNNLPACKSAYY